MSLTGKSPSETYKDIAYVDNSNNGVTTSLKEVKTGSGSSTALQVSDRSLLVKSATNNTTALSIQNASGSSKFLVDTTNDTVKALGVSVNTQYVHFGIGSGDAVWLGTAADTHYAVPFHTTSTIIGQVAMGTSTTSSFNDTNPATSLTITTLAQYYVLAYWYVPDNITIDAVNWLHAADTATGEATAAHLMAYTVDIANGSTSGDLSSGTVVADGANITNAGYEQVYYQSMTIQSADVDAGKVILFTFASDTINSDYTINATVKYHIR